MIGKNGKLTGYGGGLARKQWLIEHELRHKLLMKEIKLTSPITSVATIAPAK